MRTIGTYEILCLINNRRYIGGSSRSIENRFSYHKSILNQNVHYNRHLQRDWNKYGSSKFEFRITCVCLKSEVIACEQKKLDYWKDRDLAYNLSPNSKDCTGSKRTKNQRKHLSESAIARCTPEWRKAVSKRVKLQHTNGNFGQKTWTASSKRIAHRKISLALRGKPGGRLGKKATLEQKEHYHLAALKRSSNPTYLKKISGKNHWNYGNPSPMRGRKWTDEQRANMKLVAKAREARKRAIKGSE